MVKDGENTEELRREAFSQAIAQLIATPDPGEQARLLSKLTPREGEEFEGDAEALMHAIKKNRSVSHEMPPHDALAQVATWLGLPPGKWVAVSHEMTPHDVLAQFAAWLGLPPGKWVAD